MLRAEDQCYVDFGAKSAAYMLGVLRETRAVEPLIDLHRKKPVPEFLAALGAVGGESAVAYLVSVWRTGCFEPAARALLEAKWTPGDAKDAVRLLLCAGQGEEAAQRPGGFDVAARMLLDPRSPGYAPGPAAKALARVSTEPHRTRALETLLRGVRARNEEIGTAALVGIAAMKCNGSRFPHL
jgi:hypothetical protein